MEGHQGPVTGVDVHGSSGSLDFSDLLVSSSTDWSIKLWSRKSTKCLYSFEDAGDYVNDVKWAPTHPAVFAAADGRGQLEIYNLNESTEVPLVKSVVSQKALNKMAWSVDGRSIVTGDSGGTLSLCDVGDIAASKSEDFNRLEHVISKLLSEKSI